ncbi:hypothetical protein AMECASPLE_031164 [Ameca splendens]|uniref:Uncharacterized protein n=1 Tax=Ameca splendens TaxID=208324 RepID=A0ABV0YU02_9TELE
MCFYDCKLDSKTLKMKVNSMATQWLFLSLLPSLSLSHAPLTPSNAPFIPPSFTPAVMSLLSLPVRFPDIHLTISPQSNQFSLLMSHIFEDQSNLHLKPC